MVGVSGKEIFSFLKGSRLLDNDLLLLKYEIFSVRKTMDLGDVRKPKVLLNSVG